MRNCLVLFFFLFSLHTAQGHGLPVDSVYNALKKEGYTDHQIALKLLDSTEAYYYAKPYLALEYALKAEDIFYQKKDKRHAAVAYSYIGYIYHNLDLRKAALDYYTKAFKLFRETGYDAMKAWNFVNIGNVYYDEELFDMAKLYYDKALVLFEKHHLLHGISVVMLNYGLIKQSQNEPDSALYFYNRSLEYRKKDGYKFGIAHILTYIGNIKNEMGDFAAAINVINSSNDLIRESGEKQHVIHRQLSVNFVSLSRNYVSMKKYPEALLSADSALHYALNLSDTNRIIGALTLKAEIWDATGAINKAINAYQEAKTLSYLSNKHEKTAAIYLNLAKIFIKQGKSDEALDYINAHIALQEVIAKDRNVQKLLELRIAFETFTRDAEILLLKTKNTQNRRIIALILLSGFMLLFFLSYYFYFRIKRTKRAHQIIEALFDGYLIHKNGIITDTNKAFLKFTAYKKEDVLKKSIYDFIPQEMHQTIRKDINDNGKNAFYRTKLRIKSGSFADVDIEALTISFMGKKMRVIAVKDIREEVYNTRQVALFKTIIEQNYDTIIITDAQGNVEYVNPSFTKMTGYNYQETVGKKLEFLSEGPHNDTLYSSLWTTLKSGQVWQGQLKNKAKSGKIFWEQATITPIKENNQIIKFAAVKKDITERVLMEQRQIIFIEQLSKIFDKIDAFVFVIDLASQEILFNNEAAKKEFSINKNADYKKTIFQDDHSGFVPLPKELIDEDDNMYQRSIRKEVFIKRLGSWYDFVFQLIKWTGDKKAILLVAYNVSMHKKHIDELNELNATKDKFFSIIAHDLKNPFHSILGFTEILLSNIDLNETEKVKQILTHIKEVVHNTNELLENLLEWARSQTGAIQPNPKNFKLQDAAALIIKIFEKQASTKKIVIKKDIPQDLIVFSDEQIFNLVLRNLISNAIKFSNIGGVVTVSAIQRDDDVMLSVQDNGLGIPEEIRESLFKIDAKFSAKGTMGEKGTGLGLILCRELVEKNKGYIFADSVFGKGSKFSFTIQPQQENEEMA